MTNEHSQTYEERINQVCTYQKKFGMEPRNDSYLTKMYANNETEWNAETVAKELVCVDYIYKHTLYGEFIEDYMRCLASLVRNKYHLNWNDTWEIVRFYGPVSLKLMALTTSSTRIPNFTKGIVVMQQ